MLVLSFELPDNKGAVKVEVDSPNERRVGYGTDVVVEDAQQSFSKALEEAQRAARIVLDGFVAALDPTELELTFGLKLTAEAGMVIASTGVEASFGLKAKWIKKD